ncbi:50S ribosomal protein L25 [Camellia lanceoleosa]|uniref:50S ribosomal protein L25 n=1 Tax=Camellia lanceoleosa TaxID=1840588 RepID=A0ACC0I0C0_9ERIC|nr:50S ribosomal protein L25 [Camellia lanceoleosa]
MSKWWGAAGSLRKTVEATRRSYHTIQAIPREYTGRKVSATDRLQGRIPAVVLAQDNGGHATSSSSRSASRKQLVTTERKQIQAILNSVQLPFFCSTTFPLQIRAGSGSSTLLESGTVLPIKIHRDEESGKILNLVFVWADEGSELKVDVPVVFKGEDVCPGLKKGGTLNRIRTTLKYLCPAEHIPPKIEVDISNLDIEDKVFMHDIEVHPSLKLLSKDESIPICKVVATKLENSEPAL